VTNEELRTMVAILGGKGAGKTKRQLIRDIMDALGQDDLDPVKGNQVLDMLKTAEAK
jgi:ABC-type phosphate/phosphonate transport system ATPase subunit